MGIPKGARGKALAEKYIDLAISEEVLSVLAPEAVIGPSNRNVKLEGDLAEPYDRDVIGYGASYLIPSVRVMRGSRSIS